MRVRVRYSKGDKVRFLSHLDMARNLRMALARAKWPVAMTQGYSPKMKVSFYAPLPVGTAGEEEYMDVVLDNVGIAKLLRAKHKGAGRKVEIPEILVTLARSLAQALPEGIALKGLYLVPDEGPNLESEIRASLYRVEVHDADAEALSSAVDKFLAQRQVLFDVERPGQTKTVDLREFVESISVVTESDPVTLFMKIRHEDGRTVRPQWVLNALLPFGADIETGQVVVDRLKLYFE